MTRHDINTMDSLLSKGVRLAWLSPDNELMFMQKITNHRSSFQKDNDNWEPGPCGEIGNGRYIALDNTEREDIIKVEDILWRA